MQTVAVGDALLAGDGGWAQVTHTRRVLHRGAMVIIDLKGGGRTRATRAQPFAVGPGHFADADHLTAGQTMLVPVARLPASVRENRPHLAWLETVQTGTGHRTHLRTPWGHFLAEPPDRSPKDSRELAPTLAGRYRITPAGLVRLALPPGRGKSTMGEAIQRHHQVLWSQTFPPPPVLFHRVETPPPAAGVLVCEQSVSCRREGDRIDFGVGAPRGAPARPPRALCRHVETYGISSHAGWVFGLSLCGADTLVVDGALAMHFPQAPPEISEADGMGG